MPGRDGTGPMGQGPMTGRGAGFCAGFSAPGFANFPRLGLGFRRGRGCGPGRGFARRAYPSAQAQPAQPVQLSKDQQLQALENEKNQLQSRLKTIEDRMKELKK